MTIIMDRLHPKQLVLLGFWLALIFITSCYFIDSTSFIHFLQALIPAHWWQAGIKAFWESYAGLLIVKGWHAAEFAILTLIGAAAGRRLFGWNPARAAVVALALAILFAASDEWHQTFVPGRDGCARDVLIDSIGAIIAAVWLVRKTRAQESSTRVEESVVAVEAAGP